MSFFVPVRHKLSDMRHCDCMPPPPPPKKGPVEYIPSRTYPDPFVNMVPGYVPMHRAGCCGPFIPACPPPPPGPPEPQPEWGCPPKIYRHAPEVDVVAGEHITVTKEVTADNTLATYTVNSVQWPVKIDDASDDVLYGDGTPGNPLGVYDFVGATSTEDGKPGTVPAPAKYERNRFLRGDGTWAPIVIPKQEQSDWAQDDDTKSDYIKNKPGVFKGATVTVAGRMGFVPAPTKTDHDKFLKGDGTWADVDNTRECSAAEMTAWLDEVDNG